MPTSQDTDALLSRLAAGDASAIDVLFDRYRGRLRRMVQVHFDDRLAARTDPSDVVQETMAEAHKRLPSFLRDRPVHFYVWLRAIAKDRLIDAQRRHLHAQRRSVTKEAIVAMPISDQSVYDLARVLQVSATSPSGRAERREELDRMRVALDQMDPIDREVLTLRYLERVSAKEASEVLGISANAFTKRHIRAIVRLRELLGG